MEPREAMYLEAMKYYELSEIPGEFDNAIIMGWFKEMGFSDVLHDEVAWCSLFINIICKRLNYPYSGKLTARSWGRIGKQIIFPKIGNICIFYREKRTSWKGHVGLFSGYNIEKTKIWTLGGNQRNRICHVAYPIVSPDFGLLEYREINETHI